ncbi:hypothetical protein [Pseudomonas sp. 51_B]|uniref:hypothetical protein n=1 Tax=Pseudomonas sp. 51_B TaxID=2813573 RepID=UPI001A9EE47A|nr:hypothetical protein [Pseudomonas sp. 51_B]
MSDNIKVATAWALWGFLAIGFLGWTLFVVLEYVQFPCDSKLDLAPWVAIFISLLALGATVWQAHLSRAHNKLSVRPHLAGHSTYNDEGVYKFELRNVGLGPAIITGARVYRNGVLVEGEGPPLVIKVFDGVPGCELLEHEFFYLEYVLPAGSSVEICTVKFDEGISDIDTFLAGHLALELDYMSAYEELLPMFSTRKA